MNETLEQETFEEINNYKITYDNKNDFIENELNDEISEENNSTIEIADGTDITDKTLDKNNLDINLISEECTALVTLKENRLLTAQTMFKKSIKVSIKSFLISLSLSFLNLFI